MQVGLDDHGDDRVEDQLHLVRVRGAGLVHVDGLARVGVQRLELVPDEQDGLVVGLRACSCTTSWTGSTKLQLGQRKVLQQPLI